MALELVEPSPDGGHRKVLRGEPEMGVRLIDLVPDHFFFLLALKRQRREFQLLLLACARNYSQRDGKWARRRFGIITGAMTDTAFRPPPPPGVTGDKVVETAGLSKVYGTGIVAVDRLDLNVYRGEVYGFLGPNGAGKTTTLMMLLGRIRPTAGSAKVMGSAPGTPGSLVKVGAIVETPAFYPYLTGYDNLRLLAIYCGVPLARVHATLDQVRSEE